LASGKVAAKLLHVLDARAAPPIDRLVIVKYGEWIALATHQQTHPAVLDGVRVLKLIDHHVAEATLIMRKHVRLIAPQLKGAQQQLREVDDAGLRTGRLVGGVESDELVTRRVARVLQHRGAPAPRPCLS
jgi:hypothetical protein